MYANVSIIVRNMMMSKKVSEYFDSKSADAIESVTEIDNLKSELGDAQSNRSNVQWHESCHKSK